MRVIINPDQEYSEYIKKRLKDNNGYCPCAIEKNRDTKCKCKAFREQVQKGVEGECECGLYIAITDEDKEI